MSAPEKEIEWRHLAPEDSIYSDKTNKWYEVDLVLDRKGKIEVHLTGVKVPFSKEPTEKVTVRRAATGQVVDMFVAVFSSSK